MPQPKEGGGNYGGFTDLEVSCEPTRTEIPDANVTEWWLKDPDVLSRTFGPQKLFGRAYRILRREEWK